MLRQIAVVTLTALVVGPWWISLVAVGFLLLGVLNGPFLRFVARREGILFALGTLLTHWFIYILSGLGVVLALLGVRSGGR